MIGRNEKYVYCQDIERREKEPGTKIITTHIRCH